MKKRVILAAIIGIGAIAVGFYTFKGDKTPPKLGLTDDVNVSLAQVPNDQLSSDARAFDSTNPPNIVIIMADDLGWNDVGYHGSEIRTPNLDKLAAGGVELNRFYAHPTCTPTRAALMTGKSPVRLGVLAPLSKNNPKGLPIEEVTLADRLRERGYQTALIGKWHLGGRTAAYMPNARGFDHFFGNLMGGIGFWDHVHGGGYDLQRNGETVRNDEYITHQTAKEASHIIKTRDKNRPLFMFASFNAPHLPNEAPEETIAKYSEIENENRRIHAAMVSEFDDGVGQVFAALESEGMLDNTLIWFMSDNGGLIAKSQVINYLPDWVLGKITAGIMGEEVEMTPKFTEFVRIQLTEGASNNAPLQQGKTSLWEGGLRVPSIVYWKGVLEPSKSDQMIAMQDVMPTLLALSGHIFDQGSIDGRSVWPALSGKAKLESNPLVTVSGPGVPSYSVIFYPWKLVESPDGELNLYNVEADPTEQYEFSVDYPKITKKMHDYLQNFPRGKSIHLSNQVIVNDTDFFGGEEDRKPWSETVLTVQ